MVLLEEDRVEIDSFFFLCYYNYAKDIFKEVYYGNIKRNIKYNYKSL